VGEVVSKLLVSFSFKKRVEGGLYCLRPCSDDWNNFPVSHSLRDKR